ncbi:hypothetical protein [Cupriavidus pampae]|jgi:hypothetical protein|uniref:Uncharacterized protein n=1 Tax=Cupriavidus pampae TaxID=659251 RepID=A0ABN7ZI31_9BURK|nr:hypothetical protein [Cupriavidus pampae]CAG9183702.1 hypothetical protein LMG32289_05396 [Cupriavidus pampae]
MTRTHRLKKTAVTFVALTSSATVAWASCGGTEPLVVTAAGAAATALVANVGAIGAQLIATDTVQTQYMISALKVMTQQLAQSSEKNTRVSTQAEEALASVVKDVSDRKLVDKIMLDYSSQGFDPCGQLTGVKTLAKAETTARTAVPTRLRTEVEATGGRYGVQADILRAREDQHRKLFCTQADVDAGVCSSVGKIPGGDTNAALIFNTDTSADMVTARNAVINNIIGMPDAALPKGVVNTPEGSAYVLEKKKKDAYLGLAANSLKSLQIDTETLNAPMAERIGQYFGTSRAMQWAQDQASQAQRGVLVDIVKIQGLQLKQLEQNLRSNLRTEANLAALLELENQGGQAQLAARAEQVALAQEAARKVAR